MAETEAEHPFFTLFANQVLPRMPKSKWMDARAVRTSVRVYPPGIRGRAWGHMWKLLDKYTTMVLTDCQSTERPIVRHVSMVNELGVDDPFLVFSCLVNAWPNSEIRGKYVTFVHAKNEEFLLGSSDEWESVPLWAGAIMLPQFRLCEEIDKSGLPRSTMGHWKRLEA